MSTSLVPLTNVADSVLVALLYPEADTVDMAIHASKLALAVPNTLSTDAEALDCQGLLDDCKTLMAEIESRREAAKAPVLELGRRIDAVAKVPSTHLESAIGILRSRLTQYAAAQARAKFEAEERARQEHEANPGEYATPAITEETREAAVPVVKVKTRTSKTVRITDDSLIPLKFRPVDVVAVRQALVAGEAVPGAELVIEKKAT